METTVKSVRTKQNTSCREQFRYITKALENRFMWPKEDNPNNVNSKFYFKSLIYLITILFPVTFCVWHAYHFRSVANSSLIFDFTIFTPSLDFIILIAIYMNHLKKLVAYGHSYYTGNDHDQRPSQKIELNYKMVSKVMRIVLTSCLITCSLFRSFENENCQKRKLNKNSLESCGLLLPVYLPFDYEVFPIKQYILIHQMISVYLGFDGLMHGVLIPVIYLDKTIGAMDYMIDLVHRLNSFIEDDKKIKEYMRKIVNIHELVIREKNEFNNIWRLINMTNFMICRLVIATSIFDILETGSVLSMIHCSLWIIFSAGSEFAGQLIIDRSLEFENALHNVKWYEIKKLEDRKSFLLIFLMSQRPVALDEGPFEKMSLPSLLQFLKATYSGTATLLRMIK